MPDIIERFVHFITELPPWLINIGVLLGILAILLPIAFSIVRKIKNKYNYWEKWGKHKRKMPPQERIDYIVVSIDNGTSTITKEENSPEES